MNIYACGSTLFSDIAAEAAASRSEMRAAAVACGRREERLRGEGAWTKTAVKQVLPVIVQRSQAVRLGPEGTLCTVIELRMYSHTSCLHQRSRFKYGARTSS